MQVSLNGCSVMFACSFTSSTCVQLEDGLTHEVEADGKHMLMLPTFITQLPDGYVCLPLPSRLSLLLVPRVEWAVPNPSNAPLCNDSPFPSSPFLSLETAYPPHQPSVFSANMCGCCWGRRSHTTTAAAGALHSPYPRSPCYTWHRTCVPTAA